jgi:hypothetical protein
MAHKHEVEIIISDTGEIKFHIKGIKGPKCMDIAKILGETKEATPTSEYYEQEKTESRTKQKLK